MLVDFNDVFWPSEEKKEQWAKTVREAQEEALEKKECWMCENTYTEYWCNHGHEDYTTQCKFTKECVDFSNGMNCPKWKAKEIV